MYNYSVSSLCVQCHVATCRLEFAEFPAAHEGLSGSDIECKIYRPKYFYFGINQNIRVTVKPRAFIYLWIYFTKIFEIFLVIFLNKNVKFLIILTGK